MEEKLAALEERYDAIARELQDPAVYSDPARAAKLSREQKELAPVVEAYRDWKRAVRDAADALELASEPEMRELAQEELDDAKERQAALWERYMSARLINGDRTVLSREAHGWTAHGSPYAGSSRCFVNESHPLRAVVMLEQGSACGISRLSLPAAFQRLYAGTTINSWNASYVARVCDLLTALAAEAPVYHLVCTPDEAAVRTLAAELWKEGC